LIEDRSESLRTGQLGSEFPLDGSTFRLYRQDRNTIYRVSGRFEWFLKLSNGSDTGPITREQLGAGTVHQVLNGRPGYRGASVTRVALTPAYVLATAIPGKPLNRALMAETWFPGNAGQRLQESFATLGALLATLHAKARIGADAPSSSKDTFEALRKLLDKAPTHDVLANAIGAWFQTQQHGDRDETFVHGNVRLDNVLRVADGLGFVDLEHCGRGSSYHDLSRPVSQLLLTQAIVTFPRKRAQRFLRTFLTEYRGIRPYDAGQLDRWVTARLSRYYLESLKRRLLPNRVGGLPVMPRRLEALTTAVLRDGIAAVLPGAC
jgi:Ser/Thr protein kinase RdoA (MazF antagonist)